LGDDCQCLTDGSATTSDVLLQDPEDPPRSIHRDEDVRARIYQRYRHFHGERYANTLLDMLTRSEVSVFTHGDVAPRNIMVDESGHIMGIVDWELAGWYPDYWKYANILKPSNSRDVD
jgi:thiamine kinase-like enzyme